MAKQKYYVVWQGTKIGVFDNWEDCSKQIKGFTDAKFKSFDSKTIAEKAFRDGYQQHLTNNKVPNSNTSAKQKKATEVHWNALCVDAACSGNPGDMEYRGVLANTGKEVFRQGPFREGTNNVGEFLAIVHGLALLKNRNDNTTPIYSDSRNAMLWVAKKKANTKLEATAANKPIFALLQRAENWLQMNKYSNKILKWETEDWGEIPADFGRK
ncbi:MAG: ribonuclease H family protein [Saprospiraceae bacterium]|nr:ribonuclease H family protein [Saprospiraceae bacterium]MBP7680054.1 ribonuclease H family protein [Saprospiraceae bacterium]